MEIQAAAMDRVPNDLPEAALTRSPNTLTSQHLLRALDVVSTIASNPERALEVQRSQVS